MREVLRLLQGAMLHLSLSKTQIGLSYVPNGWRPRPVLLFDGPTGAAPDRDPTTLTAALAPVLSEGRYAGASLSVTFGDEWARLFMVPMPKNSFRLQDVRTAAAMRFQTLYGDDAAAWRITCDDAFEGQFLACAMPNTLYAVIEGLAAAHGLRLVSLVPSFVATWNRVYRRLGRSWLGLVHEETIVVGCVGGTAKPQLEAVQRLRLTGTEDGWWLAEQLHAMALRHGLDGPRDLALFGRYVPGLVPKTPEADLAVTWPEHRPSARPKKEPLIDLSSIGGART